MFDSLLVLFIYFICQSQTRPKSHMLVAAQTAAAAICTFEIKNCRKIDRLPCDATQHTTFCQLLDFIHSIEITVISYICIMR